MPIHIVGGSETHVSELRRSKLRQKKSEGTYPRSVHDPILQAKFAS